MRHEKYTTMESVIDHTNSGVASRDIKTFSKLTNWSAQASFMQYELVSFLTTLYQLLNLKTYSI